MINKLAENQLAKRVILQNTLWLLSEKAIVMGGGLVLSIFIARYLGAQSFGRYSYLTSFVALFAPLFALGMSNVLLREFARTPDKIADIITTCLTSRLLSGLTFTLITCVVLYFVDETAWKSQALLILLIANISNAFEVYNLWFVHRSDNKTLVVWRIGCFTLFALVKGLVIWRYQAVLPLIWVIAVEVVVKNVGYKWLYQRVKIEL